MTDAEVRKSAARADDRPATGAWARPLLLCGAAAVVAGAVVMFPKAAPRTTAETEGPSGVGPAAASVSAPAQSGTLPPPDLAPNLTSPSPPASSGRSQPVGGTTPRGPAKPARVVSPTRPDCKPPYTLDRDGIRVAKPECI